MQVYNHTRKLFTNGDVAIGSLKAMLVNTYTFDATQTVMTDIETDEVSGNGWTAGGEALANAAVTTASTSASRLDADDISVTATGGDIGPATGLVVYDSSVNDYPLFYFEFASAQTAGDGTPFNVTWNANGIYQVSAPA